MVCDLLQKLEILNAAGTQFNPGLQSSARIQARSHFLIELTASFERHGAFRTAVAPEKLRTISGIRSLPPAEVCKGDPPAEFPAPSTSRE